MSERVYRFVKGIHPMFSKYEIIDPNPLDEIERLKGELVQAHQASAEFSAVIARSGEAEVAHLRGLLRQDREAIAEVIAEMDDSWRWRRLRDRQDAIDAALDGECKHDGGFVVKATRINGVFWLDGQDSVHLKNEAVFCRLCGAPASEVEP